MTKKPLLILIACVLILLGVWSSARNRESKNIDLMRGEDSIIIVTEENLEYFPGALGYFARPEKGGNYPGVVMIHENRGLRPEIKESADALAQRGYLVLAVDLLGGIAEDQDGARALTSKYNQQTGVENMKAAVAYLKENGATKIASLGWCFGGRQSLELAISGEKLDATVVYYGGGMATSTEKLSPIKWPVLGIFGDQDRVIPLEMVDQFKSSLATLGINHEVHIYPGVGHAFANPSGANYAPEATKDAWGKTLSFLEKNLK